MPPLSLSISSLVRKSLLLAGVCALTTTLLPGTAGAAQVGAVADITWGQPRSAVDREIEMLKAAGVGWVRANASWIMLEPNGKGRIDEGALADYDYAIDRARAAGLKVLMPISDGVPYWASADPHKYVDSSGKRHWKRLYQPADMKDYGDIVRFVTSHFSGRGVHTYEIWNEPNHEWFWPSGPDPAAYVPMLKAGYQAVKGVDPGATVLLGGLSKSDYRFLEGIYAAGGGPYFDAVSVHPYTGGVDPTWAWNGTESGEDPQRLSWKSFPAIKEVKATMDTNGDHDKQVWLTEFGYSTTTAAYGVSTAKQAEYLTKAYNYIEQFNWVHSMFWYSARNLPSAADADTEPAQYGLMSTTFEPKLAYWALRDYTLTKATEPVLDAPLPSEPAPEPAPGPEPAPEPEPGPAPEPAPKKEKERRHPAKLQVARSSVISSTEQLDVLAPITKRASGTVDVVLHAAGRHESFQVDLEAGEGRLRFDRPIPNRQARMGTGILTISYPGNDSSRPQEVRLRAASRQAKLDAQRTRYEDGRVQSKGTVSSRARGVVRVQLEWVTAGAPHTVELDAKIRDGRWSLDETLTPELQASIADREGTLHSYTLFTGYLPAMMRGEMQSYEVLGER